MTTEAAQPLGDVILRTASAQDAGAVANLLAAANAEHASGFPHAIWASYRRELAAVAQRIFAAEVLLAEAEGAPVGTVTLYTDADVATLRLLAVPPDLRGAGVGRLLVEECCARALAAGCTAIELHTAHLMHAAIRLYEGLGFVRSPERDFDAHQRYGVRLTGPDVEPFRGLAYRRQLGRR